MASGTTPPTMRAISADRMKATVPIAMALAIAGCVATSDRESDLIRAALVELGRSPVIVLPDSLPVSTRRAASTVGPTLPEHGVVASAQWRLPPNHFVLQRVEISGADGTITGLVGPVPASRPGIGLLACGRHVVMLFKRAHGVWRLQETQETVC